MRKDKRFKDKDAAVTGGAQGIGKAIADALRQPAGRVERLEDIVELALFLCSEKVYRD